jgi:NMD protein affecting ribosome stability and mRNA decay
VNGGEWGRKEKNALTNQFRLVGSCYDEKEKQKDKQSFLRKVKGQTKGIDIWDVSGQSASML